MHRVSRFLPLALLLAAPPAFGQHWFDAPLRPLTPEQGTFLYHGDLDLDGDEDLISGMGSKLFVFLNDGSGDFSLGQEVTLQPGEDVSLGALLDIDGDGLLDLAQGTASAAVVFRRGLGTGGFGAPIPAALPVGSPYQFEPAQADADAAFELAVLGILGPYVAWIDWSAGGPVTMPAIQLPAFGSVGTIASLDFDGDGDEDIIFGAGSTLQVLLTTASHTLALGHAFSSGLASDFQLQAGDLDGDGDEDLVALAQPFAPPQVVAIENLAPGLAAGPAQTIPVSSLLFIDANQPAHLGDRDADGDLDLAVSDAFAVFSGPLELVFMENTGGLSFANTIAEDGFKAGPGAGFADFDGDGKLDLCSSTLVAFGDGTYGGYHGTELSTIAFSGAFHPSHDFEGDGDLDLTWGSHTYRNDGGGQFQGIQTWPAPAAGHKYEGPAAFADFDGDARADQLVGYVQISPFVFKGMHLLVANGVGGYEDAGQVAAESMDGGSTGDVDNDGDLDVLVPGKAFLNDGQGGFQATAPLPTGAITVVHDADQDGDDDLIAKGDSTVTVFHQTAPLSFTGTVVASFAPSAGGLQLVDFDGDGLLDLARTGLQPDSLTPGGSTLHLLRGNGVAFDAPLSLPFQPHFQQRLAAEDVDGDGVLDLLAGSLESPSFSSPHYTLTIYPGLGGPLAYGEPRFFASKRIGSFADLDEDGDLDAVGEALIAGHRVHGAAGGEIRQYGAGFPGTGGAAPVLGADGPPTTANPAAEVRIVQAVGGGFAWLVFSLSEAALADQPLPGMKLFVGGAPGIIPHIPLGGPAGAPGAGSLAVPLPKIPALFGLSIYHQVFVFDPGSVLLWSSSNGLEIRFGP